MMKPLVDSDNINDNYLKTEEDRFNNGTLTSRFF
jgi:hypothetical protein